MPDTPAAMIELREISKRIGDTVHAMDRVSLRVDEGAPLDRAWQEPGARCGGDVP